MTREIVLTNMSEVVMTFGLRVPLEDKRTTSTRKEGNQEFSIQPRADTLPPGIPQTIKVSTAQQYKAFSGTSLLWTVLDTL